MYFRDAPVKAPVDLIQAKELQHVNLVMVFNLHKKVKNKLRKTKRAGHLPDPRFLVLKLRVMQELKVPRQMSLVLQQHKAVGELQE